MSKILGHDCNGKPLRVGDRVELVGLTGPSSQYNGTRCHVRGPSPLKDGDVEIDLKTKDVMGHIVGRCKWEYFDVTPHRCRRIDNHEPGDWSEIARLTKWHPTKQADPETTA